MSKKHNKKEYRVNMKLSTATGILICSGLVCIIVSNILLNAFTKDFLSKYYATKPILDIVNTIGSTLFSGGIVSVLVEISTIKNLVSNAFENILSGDFQLNGLNQNALIKLKQDISLQMLGMEKGRDLANTPYKYENKLLETVHEKYFKHHNITYHITPDEKNDCFHIKTKIDYSIVNRNLIENYFEVKLKLYDIPNIAMGKNDSIGNNFSVTLNINGEEINTEDALHSEPIKHNGESTYYNRKVRIYKELSGAKNKIKAVLNYDVPMYDTTQSFKISSPCKSIEHKFYINQDAQTGDEWMIHANAYGTFYHRQDDEDSNYNVEQNVDDSLIIRYTDWALVGNGYCVYYQKKH